MTTEDSKALLRFHIEEPSSPVTRRGQDSIACLCSSHPTTRLWWSRGLQGRRWRTKPGLFKVQGTAHSKCRVVNRSPGWGRLACMSWESPASRNVRRRSGFLIVSYMHQIEPTSIRSMLQPVLVHLPSETAKIFATRPLSAATRIVSPHGEKQQLRARPACLAESLPLCHSALSGWCTDWRTFGSPGRDKKCSHRITEVHHLRML